MWIHRKLTGELINLDRLASISIVPAPYALREDFAVSGCIDGDEDSAVVLYRGAAEACEEFFFYIKGYLRHYDQIVDIPDRLQSTDRMYE